MRMRCKPVFWALVLSATPAIVWASGDPAAGQKKAAVCAACHGADGNSTNATFPILAGQYRNYLAEALEDYKSGKRKNSIMNGMAASLSPRDIANLASWFSSQSGPLFTPRPE